MILARVSSFYNENVRISRNPHKCSYRQGQSTDMDGGALHSLCVLPQFVQ
jgi:hypothetical protein